VQRLSSTTFYRSSRGTVDRRGFATAPFAPTGPGNLYGGTTDKTLSVRLAIFICLRKGVPFMPQFLFFLFVAVFYASSCIGAEIPTSGLVHNTKEMSSLSYSCTQNGVEINCEFSQSSVRKQAAPDDFPALQDKWINDFDKNGPDKLIDESTCKTSQLLLDVFEGKTKAPKKDLFEKMSSFQRKDMGDMSKATVAFCNKKTKENFIKLMQIDYEKNMRTCRVSSTHWIDTFKQVKDFDSGNYSWVVKSTPEGPCGTVQLSRFVPEKLEDSKIIMWKFIAKKIVTNPQGSLFPGFSCSDLDQKEYLYDWRSQHLAPGCEYIEFSSM